MEKTQIADEVHQRLGYKRLHKTWAKLEILFGLLAAGAGLFLGLRGELAWESLAAGLGLFALGTYLTLAGHRSHLYQSANDRVVLLIEEMRRLHRE